MAMHLQVVWLSRLIVKSFDTLLCGIGCETSRGWAEAQNKSESNYPDLPTACPQLQCLLITCCMGLVQIVTIKTKKSAVEEWWFSYPFITRWWFAVSQFYPNTQHLVTCKLVRC